MLAVPVAPACAAHRQSVPGEHLHTADNSWHAICASRFSLLRCIGGIMKLKAYHFGELIGIVFLLGSTAMQLFYVEPLKREIEWRLVAFNTQQSAQIQIRANSDNHIALLKLMNAPTQQVEEAAANRDKLLDRYQNSDANIAEYTLSMQQTEEYLGIFVMVLFALGTLLAGFGRAMEMVAANKAP